MLLILQLALSGCSSIFSVFGGGEEASRLKPPAKEAVVFESEITKRDLKRALTDELKTAQMRAVEVFQNSSSAQNYPSFRLFDIQPGSVYDLLGLKNADIVVAINQRVVVNNGVIAQIVRLLPRENDVSFEVLREGKSTFLKIAFVD